MQEEVPWAEKILVTAARPQLAECSSNDDFLGEKFGKVSDLCALNAISRRAARRMHWQILDYAAMTEMFTWPDTYLRDRNHGNTSILAEVLNLGLNIVKEGLDIRKVQRTNAHVSLA